MKSRKHYVIPGEKVPSGAKLKNGIDYNNHMVGAYYGSSFELNIVAMIQVSNAGQTVAPADDDLLKMCKPKRSKGEFGALKDESTTVSQKQLGKVIFELRNIEEVTQVANAVDSLKGDQTWYLKDITYTDRSAKTLTASQMLKLREEHKASNLEVQKRKTQLIKDYNCEKFFANGRWSSPEYPQELLESLQTINSNELWSPTGVNLLIRVSGLHTIAKNNSFYGGSLDQTALDNLSEKLDYKESNSFFKGKVKNGQFSIPIQSVAHFKNITNKLMDRALTLQKFPEAVSNSRIKLVLE